MPPAKKSSGKARKKGKGEKKGDEASTGGAAAAAAAAAEASSSSSSSSSSSAASDADAAAGGDEEAMPLRDADGRWRPATEKEARGLSGKYAELREACSVALAARLAHMSGGGGTDAGEAAPPATGYFGSLTEDQWELLVQMRAELAKQVAAAEPKGAYDWAPLYLHDVWLTRFLRARNFDFAAASTLLASALKHRTEFFEPWGGDVDRFLAEYPESAVGKAFLSFWPCGRHGRDATAPGPAQLPIYYERVAHVEAKPLFVHATHDDIMTFHIYTQEVTERGLRDAYMVEHNMYLDQSLQQIYIQDISKLGLRQFYRPGLDTVGAIGVVDDSIYPESLAVMVIIGVGRVFSVFWKVVKGFFSPETRAKFIFCSKDADAFDNISHFAGGAEGLPAYVPGSKCKEHKDGRCLPGEGGAFTGWDEEGGDSSGEGSDGDDDDGAAAAAASAAAAAAASSTDEGRSGEEVAVAAGARVCETFVVARSGTEIVWSVSTTVRDIRVALLYADDHDAAEHDHDDAFDVLQDDGRIDCRHDDAHTSAHMCEHPGCYRLVFDNSFSRMRGKEVSYVVGVTPPPERKKSGQGKGAGAGRRGGGGGGGKRRRRRR